MKKFSQFGKGIDRAIYAEGLQFESSLIIETINMLLHDYCIAHYKRSYGQI